MIGIIGGTFDPIHFGHLRTALEIAEGCGMEQVRFIPGSIPPHRPQPLATAEQRLEMVRLAIGGEDKFIADPRELARVGESYTVETLQSLRDDFGDDVPLAFIMGMDAFLSFRSWHRWQDIMKMAHLVVMHRPGYEPDASEWHGETHVQEHCELQQSPAGRVAFQAVTQLDISATFIREACRNGNSLHYLMPEAVRAYIAAHDLYRKF
uniref:Probable nicotinate-nucleotide adenylyltransferase n=1 Tax=uncultured Thiotrichaceae bacterium TaxID=298394 RepID=A0A6S6TC13_9GAMM|nr:MAG: Nicotinate-nucleotide adenylyltransferase (EC [uncultured Thiotrichaceae bacterium]